MRRPFKIRARLLLLILKNRRRRLHRQQHSYRESFIHHITILSTIPSAGIGAILAIRITNSDLNMIALISVILLIGIVKKNAILMVDLRCKSDAEHISPLVPTGYKACLLISGPSS